MKTIPVCKLWEFETLGVEMSGLIAAFSIALDALSEGEDNNKSPEVEALYGILCAMLKQKREFEALYHAAVSEGAL